jgi:hypothetical protein
MITTQPLQVQRHELKYYISWADYEYARTMLATLMQRDKHSPKRGYPIRSLYFDDICDSAVTEKLDGIEYRDKYRLRTYDPTLDWVKLERKRKNNNYVSKTSVRLSKDQALQLIDSNYQCLYEMDSPDARSLYTDFARKYLKPVVVVDYVREAYTLPYNEIRITFDKQLATNQYDFDMFDPDLSTRSIQRDDVIIMEVKYNVALPSWFPILFSLESATVSAVSKYTQARIGQMDNWLGLANY